MKTKLWLKISVMVVMTISSCQKLPETIPTPSQSSTIPKDLQDGGLLSEEPCGPPCFFQIIPGRSNSDNVAQILKDLNFNETCQWEVANYGQSVNCPTLSIIFNKDKSIVETISFAPSGKILIDKVINKYGPPDAWIVIVLDQNKLPYPVTLDLAYQKYNMVISLDHQYNHSQLYRLEQSSKVVNLTYYDDAIFPYKTGTDSWPGYGVYENP